MTGLSPSMDELLKSVRAFWKLNGRAERVFGKRQRSAYALKRRGLVRIDAETGTKKHSVVLFVEPVSTIEESQN